MSPELAAPIKINNKFESVNDLLCEESRTIETSTPMDSAPTKQEPKPPPINIYDVNNYKAMVDYLSKVVEEETCHTKALPNNTIKVFPHTHTHTPDTYRKLIHRARKARIVHHTYQIKQDRAYRIVIRGLHHSIPITDISEELNRKGHKVGNIINVKHSVSKERLPLFFVDLEPLSNNKDIFKLDLLQHCKIRIESPRRKHYHTMHKMPGLWPFKIVLY